MDENRGLEIIEGGTTRILLRGDLAQACGTGATLSLGAFLDIGKATWVTVVAAEDDYRASIPAASFTDGALLDVRTMRLTVTEGDTLCWNVKGVTSIVLGSEKLADSVPENPPH